MGSRTLRPCQHSSLCRCRHLLGVLCASILSSLPAPFPFFQMWILTLGILDVTQTWHLVSGAQQLLHSAGCQCWVLGASAGHCVQGHAPAQCQCQLQQCHTRGTVGGCQLPPPLVAIFPFDCSIIYQHCPLLFQHQVPQSLGSAHPMYGPALVFSSPGRKINPMFSLCSKCQLCKHYKPRNICNYGNFRGNTHFKNKL